VSTNPAEKLDKVGADKRDARTCYEKICGRGIGHPRFTEDEWNKEVPLTRQDIVNLMEAYALPFIKERDAARNVATRVNEEFIAAVKAKNAAERDAARELPAKNDARLQEIKGRYETFTIRRIDVADLIKKVDEARQSERDALREALKKLYASIPHIDNGKCAVCRAGYRSWKLPKCKVPAKPCSNNECLSREVEAALEVKP
jgi:hypothetical protein